MIVGVCSSSTFYTGVVPGSGTIGVGSGGETPGTRNSLQLM